MAKIVQLRREGRSLNEIADEMGVTKGRISQIISAARNRRTDETNMHIELWREEMEEQIDKDDRIAKRIRDQNEEAAPAVSLKAVEVRNKLRREIAAMYGVDEATKTENTTTINVQQLSDPELALKLQEQAVEQLEKIGYASLSESVRQRLEAFIREPVALLPETVDLQSVETTGEVVVDGEFEEGNDA